ncbi:unnamed protein product, partial [Didymodactylos carnosus]
MNHLYGNEYIDISIVLDAHLPCSPAEFEITHRVHDNLPREQDQITLENLAYEQMREKSVYSNYFHELIMKDEYLFQQYYHDQVLLFLEEYKVQLSVEFVLDLLNNNSVKSTIERIKYYLVNQSELLELLRIFEQGVYALSRARQGTLLTIINSGIKRVEDGSCLTLKTDNLYLLVLKEGSFYQILPNTIVKNVNELTEKFECTCDTFIENSLMNLVQLTVSSELLETIENIPNILIIFNRISQGILNLEQYT